MLRLLSKSLRHYLTINSNPLNHRFIATWLPSVDPNSTPKDPQSEAVSYLINSCGLSLNKATSVSKKVKIENPDRVDSVLDLLRDAGFTQAKLAKLISKNPFVLSLSPETSLKPKIEFFRSQGLEGMNLKKCVKNTLDVSLDDQIIPAFKFIRGIVSKNGDVSNAVKRCPSLITCSVERVMLPNLSTLHANGVRDELIWRFFELEPKCMTVNPPDKLGKIVSEAKEMGFSPMSRLFPVAVVGLMRRKNWERSKSILMDFGWSEEDFMSAFRARPEMMLSSKMKIVELMSFYLNKLGFEPCDIARCPNLLMMSLYPTVLRRCSVLNVLMSKGLINKGNLCSMLALGRKQFEERYVFCFWDKCPEVIVAYKGEIGFEGFTD